MSQPRCRPDRSLTAAREQVSRRTVGVGPLYAGPAAQAGARSLTQAVKTRDTNLDIRRAQDGGSFAA